MIRSHADLIAAYDNGRFHSQRFIKTGAGQGSADTKWQDWAFQSGQPAYDARIGAVGAFFPAVAVKNDAIYFPDIPAGMQRMLHKISITPRASNLQQASVDCVLYDLVGYYPLIDGDSTDPQDLDNSLPLPRYADGKGLQLVMVNHVSPAIQAGRMLLEYTDESGNAQTLDCLVPNNGLNISCSGVNTVGTVSMSNLSLPTSGVRSVNRITYSIAPGGLHCIYVIRPLAKFSHWNDVLAQGDASGQKATLEVDFALKDSWHMPIILDGAHLAFFYRVNGGGRTDTFLGEMTFIWG